MVIINSEKYINKVQEDQKKGQNIGVQSVPHVVIDNKLYVSGVQSKETLI